MRLTRRSAVLLVGLLPYVACTANAAMPWGLCFTSVRVQAAVGLALLTLPIPLGLFILYIVRWWIKILLLLIFVPLTSVLLLGWMFVVFDAYKAYDTGRDLTFDPIKRLPTTHGTVIVYRTDGGAMTRWGIVVRQERPVIPGIKRVRLLYDRYDQYDISVRLIDANDVEITGPLPPVIRSLR